MAEPTYVPPPRTRPPWLNAVAGAAGRGYGATIEEVLGDGAHREAAQARHVVAWCLRLDGYSLPHIGAILGRHHTTVLSSIRRVEADPAMLAAAWTIARAYILRKGSAA